MELTNILENIEKLEKDIHDYILNTEHYLFYWISNKEVQNFIQEYPDDYEDRFYIIVINVSDSPTIRIYFEDHPDEVEYIERNTFLPTFKDTTKARWLEWNGNIKDKLILEKEQEVKYFKKKLEETEKELEELKRNFE